MRKKSTKSAKAKHGVWFVRLRGSYIPCSWQGWLTYIPFITVLVHAQLWAQHNATSAADYIYRVVPVWVSAGVIMQVLATLKS